MRQISEKETRKALIDPALEKAGWYLRNHAQVGLEIPVDGYDAEPWNGGGDEGSGGETDKRWTEMDTAEGGDAAPWAAGGGVWRGGVRND